MFKQLHRSKNAECTNYDEGFGIIVMLSLQNRLSYVLSHQNRLYYVYPFRAELCRYIEITKCIYFCSLIEQASLYRQIPAKGFKIQLLSNCIYTCSRQWRWCKTGPVASSSCNWIRNNATGCFPAWQKAVCPHPLLIESIRSTFASQCPSFTISGTTVFIF